MNKEEILSVWAPENSIWWHWAKPVLFAHLDSALSHIPVPSAPGDVSWSPAPNENVAVVLDLPGADSVLIGLALAASGYRPVPLYNALPLPFGQTLLSPATKSRVAAVDVLPIISALRTGTKLLAQVTLPPDAPPVFLLDANRKGTRKMIPGEFDNRSVLFTTDFPSANFLASQSIQRVLLVQKQVLEPRPDLAHTLRRWQDGGLTLERLRLEPLSPREPFEVSRPAWYGAMFQRVLSAIDLRRASGGGFGAWVPDSSAGG
jgi:hypothetical protein